MGPELRGIDDDGLVGQAVHADDGDEPSVGALGVQRGQAPGQLDAERDAHTGVHVGNGKVVRNSVEVRTDMGDTVRRRGLERLDPCRGVVVQFAQSPADWPTACGNRRDVSPADQLQRRDCRVSPEPDRRMDDAARLVLAERGYRFGEGELGERVRAIGRVEHQMTAARRVLGLEGGGTSSKFGLHCLPFLVHVPMIIDRWPDDGAASTVMIMEFLVR